MRFILTLGKFLLAALFCMMLGLCFSIIGCLTLAVLIPGVSGMLDIAGTTFCIAGNLCGAVMCWNNLEW